MNKSIKLTLIISATLVVLALIAVWTVFQIAPASSANTISVSGISEIIVVPDLVSVSFSVETHGADAKEAKDKNSEIVDKLLSNLIKIGFERDEIQTTGFNVYEDISWTQSGKKYNGFIATHTIVVKMPTDKNSLIGDAIDAGIDAGANLGYINFELSQDLENEYKAQALKEATQDATIKAEAMAEGLGKELGKIVSVSNSDFGYRPWLMYDAVSSGGVAEAKTIATNIQPSEQTISAQVSVVYKIN